ncbi:GNAT family N-acetyltransferase [Mycobacterium riyadhense]|nr:GNAT family N-acetyltransferase [Mycobacterium riyadhense]
MTKHPPERMTGPRLLLRAPVLDDADALFERIGSDVEVMRYLVSAVHPDVLHTRRVITEKLNTSADSRTWAIALQSTGDVIGLTSYQRHAPHSAEVGGCVGRRWWGAGYLPEALNLQLAALADDPEVYRVWATCHVDNTPAARMMVHIGFVLEGRLAREAVYPAMGPEPCDSLLYAKILR